MFLFGSGTGGMVVAHYQGAEFSGHVIEGWGCNHPHRVFNGIRSPKNIRIFSVVSRNDRWFKDVPGFEIDCAKYLSDRPDSESIVLDRPAHYVSWYPGSREKLIKFLLKDFDLDKNTRNGLLDFSSKVIEINDNGISLSLKWSVEDVYSKAANYCSKLGKNSAIDGEPRGDVYKFICE